MTGPRYERMSDEFEKWHLGDGWAVHRFKGPDRGGPHDHPGPIDIEIKIGGYIERVYERDGSSQLIARLPGDTFTIEAEHIHEIVALIDGPCVTEVRYHPHTRETRFWRFDADGPRSRAWHEKDLA